MWNEKGYTLTELISVFPILAISVLGTYGWVWNIVKIINSNFEHLTGILICRVVGVFVVPVGAVLGYF